MSGQCGLVSLDRRCLGRLLIMLIVVCAHEELIKKKMALAAATVESNLFFIKFVSFSPILDGVLRAATLLHGDWTQVSSCKCLTPCLGRDGVCTHM